MTTFKIESCLFASFENEEQARKAISVLDSSSVASQFAAQPAISDVHFAASDEPAFTNKDWKVNIEFTFTDDTSRATRMGVVNWFHRYFGGYMLDLCDAVRKVMQ